MIRLLSWLRQNVALASPTLVMPGLMLVDTQASWPVIAFSVALLVISLGIHEAAHAWAAWKCGDSTAKDLGRMTLNPIPHIDPMMTVIVPTISYALTGFIFGGAKPVPVQFHRLRSPWRDMSLVALAGPISNLLLGVLFFGLYVLFVKTGWYNNAARTISGREYDLLPMVMQTAGGANLLLFLFNLMPLPPLDGSRVMAWLLPASLRDNYLALERFGLFIVFGVFFYVPGVRSAVFGTVGALANGLIDFFARVIPNG